MKNKIYIQHWLNFKPYDKESKVDVQYLVIANKVLKKFQSLIYIFEEVGIKDEISNMSIFLTCYLEDLVSGTNFWNTFVSIHKSKYNKELPFYSLKNYVANEVNLVDIQFLIWYYLNTNNPDRFLSPYDDYIKVLAEAVFEILDNEFDFVDENTILKNHFYLKPNVDFYETRATLQKVFFESYLLGIDVKYKLNDQIQDVIEGSERTDQNETMRIINSITDLHTHSYRTKLLALKGKEWFAAIIGNNHPLYEPIINLSEKICSFFLYKGQNQTHFHFQHVATDVMFNLSKESFDIRFHLDDNHIYYIEMILWNKEWTFSGICFCSDFDADIILDEKSSDKSINSVFQLDEKYLAESMETVKNQEKTFLKKYGSNLLFLKKHQVQTTINEFIDAHNDILIDNTKNKQQEIADAKKRQKEIGYIKTESDSFEIECEENILLFFNPNTGLEMYNDICEIFPDKKNPFVSNEDKLAIKTFLFSPIYPKELTEYFIENYAPKLDFFTKDTGKKYLVDFDFLQRFWRNENYFNKPSVTII